MNDAPITQEPIQEYREHPISIAIPEACLDPDGKQECPHSRKEIKREYNPV